MRRTMLAAALAAALVPLAGTASAAVEHGPAVIRHLGNGSAQSTNWSGYAAFGSGTTFTDVKGNWVAPSVTCPSPWSQKKTVLPW